MTLKSGPLRARALLLLLLLCLELWAQQSLALQCQPGERKITSKDAEKCCPKCILMEAGNNLCQGIEDHECRCPQGHSCGDNNCLYCRKLPECAEGQELTRIGDTDFTFQCKPCETGTYSSVKNGWCRNWTDCESSGFVTLSRGNSTHNSKCGVLPSPKDVGQALLPSSSLSTTILAILTAVAVFVLILLTFLLHFCIWTLKDKYFAAEDVDHHFPRPPAAPQLPETSSIQFPEEEHGGKTAEEKLSMLSLKVSNELSNR
ncbi:PREDICTED: tumor necrosis factor receptor superfamily member 18 isoform X2 [Lepidothrix coronata]|uniref:Tumor necrosis factor receptor superfamily member 18 isoform X2 n=1 Tax=Lepidothrix coronata TaxID=321398 RepID=A0A6J0I3C4_9PASS|nr:PREDICTED: tumor necrosis factor receptor superfamily member 18 isoform X2 [Lepidothrix coronata]